jgi:hypothetical protein
VLYKIHITNDTKHIIFDKIRIIYDKLGALVFGNLSNECTFAYH